MCDDPNHWDNVQPTRNTDPQKGPTIATYYELWRFFEERGGIDKERMITIVTWLLAFAAAVIAYIATKHVNYDATLCIKQPGQLTAFSAIGICICALALKLIWEFATHARVNFIKTDYCKKRIPNLDPLFQPEVENDDLLKVTQINYDLPYSLRPKRVGRIFRNLNYVSLGVGILFALLLIVSILSMTSVIPTCSPTKETGSVQTETTGYG